MALVEGKKSQFPALPQEFFPNFQYYHNLINSGLKKLDFFHFLSEENKKYSDLKELCSYISEQSNSPSSAHYLKIVSQGESELLTMRNINTSPLRKHPNRSGPRLSKLDNLEKVLQELKQQLDKESESESKNIVIDYLTEKVISYSSNYLRSELEKFMEFFYLRHLFASPRFFYRKQFKRYFRKLVLRKPAAHNQNRFQNLNNSHRQNKSFVESGAYSTISQSNSTSGGCNSSSFMLREMEELQIDSERKENCMFQIEQDDSDWQDQKEIDNINDQVSSMESVMKFFDKEIIEEEDNDSGTDEDEQNGENTNVNKIGKPILIDIPDNSQFLLQMDDDLRLKLMDIQNSFLKEIGAFTKENGNKYQIR